MLSFRSIAARASAVSPRLLAVRSYHVTPTLHYAYKDTQDRESLKPSGTEGTKSGHDSDVARASPNAAFNPSKTSPEEEKATAGSELEFSGANQELSKPQGDEKNVHKSSHGAGKEVRKGGKSGGGSPPKKGSPP